MCYVCTFFRMGRDVASLVDRFPAGSRIDCNLVRSGPISELRIYNPRKYYNSSDLVFEQPLPAMRKKVSKVMSNVKSFWDSE